MQTISTTEARKKLSQVISNVQHTGHTVGIASHGRVLAYLSPAPKWNDTLSDTANLAAMGGSFDYLADEPDLYTIADLKVRYV